MADSQRGAGNVGAGNLAIRRCRVVLVDDHHLFLSVLDRFMASSPEVEVVAVTTSSRKAMGLVELHRPDLLLISMSMRDISGTDVAKRYLGKPLAPKVILTGLEDDPEYRSAAISAGAAGYVAKMDLGARILPMIRSLFPRGQDFATVSAKW